MFCEWLIQVILQMLQTDEGFQSTFLPILPRLIVFALQTSFSDRTFESATGRSTKEGNFILTKTLLLATKYYSNRSKECEMGKICIMRWLDAEFIHVFIQKNFRVN